MGEPGKPHLRDILNVLIVSVAVLMSLYHLVYARFLVQSNIGHDNTHLAFCLAVAFLLPLRKNPKRWPIALGLTVVALACTGYVQVYLNDLMERSGDNTALELFIGVVLVLLVLEATRRTYGLILPVLCTIFIVYSFIGHLIPGPFRTVDIGWQSVISRLSVGISGIYGMLLTISSTYLFLFMLFSAFINATGATGFFTEVGKWVSRRFRAGPALAAVVTSGLVGSVSGSAGSNVLITGSFTIPAMKKIGYKPEQAAGIEAAASTCGPIVPPVMGTVAFIIAGFIGVPYARVIGLAAIPAVLYIFSCGCYAYFQGEKMRVESAPEEINRREIWARVPIFVVPLIVIAILFIIGYSPMFVGFWACATILALSLFQKRTRPSWRTLVEALVTGADLGAKVGVATALLGVLVLTVTMTGLAIRLPMAVSHLFADNLLLLLVFTGIISIVLGTGLPAVAAYLLVVIVIAPALQGKGVDLLQAHLFVFFLANFSFITPPVAIAALFASQLARADYFRTSLEAAVAGIGGFILPFMIIFVPALAFDFSDPLLAVTTLIACPLILVGLQSAIVGYFATRLRALERLALLACPLALILHIYTKSYYWFGIGLALGLIVWAFDVRSARAMKAAYESI